MSAKFSGKMWAMLRRIDRLPEVSIDEIKFYYKGQAKMFMKSFAKWLRNYDLLLQPLAEPTIEDKESRNLDRPESPLYGEGVDEQNSYANMFELQEIDEPNRKGYSVVIRDETHHSGLSYETLYRIHEFGATYETVI